MEENWKNRQWLGLDELALEVMVRWRTAEEAEPALALPVPTQTQWSVSWAWICASLPGVRREVRVLVQLLVPWQRDTSVSRTGFFWPAAQSPSQRMPLHCVLIPPAARKRKPRAAPVPATEAMKCRSVPLWLLVGDPPYVPDGLQSRARHYKGKEEYGSPTSSWAGANIASNGASAFCWERTQTVSGE